MTSTTDTAQHPDVSEISDLAEGLLPPSRASDIRHHLGRCPLCADVHGSLEEIRGLLGTLPGPLRMPADIAGRIDAALAAEALLDSSTPNEDAHVSRETALPSRTLTASAPLNLADHPTTDPGRADHGRPGGRARAGTGPGRSGPARRRRRTAVLGAVLGTAAVGVSVLLIQSLRPPVDSGADQQASSAVSAPADDSDVFSGSRLQGRVDGLLASGSAAKDLPGEQRGGDAGSDRSAMNSPMLQPGSDVPPCIQRGIGRTEPALAVEQGSYRGSRAYLVVLPHSVDSTRVQAYVIDATCVDSAPSTDGKVLLTRSYPKR